MKPKSCTNEVAPSRLPLPNNDSLTFFVILSEAWLVVFSRCLTHKTCVLLNAQAHTIWLDVSREPILSVNNTDKQQIGIDIGADV
jgi:hypothetical protein